MELRSDIELKGRAWQHVLDGYWHKYFETQWGIFKTCTAIGILYDHSIDDANVEVMDEGEKKDKEKGNIPRTMFNRHSSEMTYFFQSAILTTQTIELSEADRLFLAFSEEISDEEMEGEDSDIIYKGVSQQAKEFDKISFLKGFANYGATKLESCISKNDSETMENLAEFLNASFKGETDELRQMKEVADLDDYDEIIAE